MARRILFLTGDSDNDAVREFVAGTGRPCIGKPFTLDDVRRAVHGAALGA
jgi:hypothetical protein